mmetsp:Transcript_27206/g.30520  ORF Transcript_27206/g.30520 Transcript_27206/m.30520 type:complete len:328 (+) Transcript_27206:192-1175(+)
MRLQNNTLSSIVSLLIVLFSAVIVSEAFAASTSSITTTTTTTMLTTPSQSTAFTSLPINNNNNNMLLRRSTTTTNNNNRNSMSSSSSSSYRTGSSGLNLIHNTIPYRGGGRDVIPSSPPSKMSLFTAASGNDATDKCPFTKSLAIFGSVWGSLGVIYILAKAIFRVLPIALEPFQATSSFVLSPIQWSLYAVSCLFFAYAEGYKGFHLKFSPLVVKRSFTLVLGTTQGNNPINYLLAPLFSMGLFSATRKRMIVSWSISIGVAIIVALVKKLSPVPRCILDAGVVVGLSVGSISILYHYLRSMITGTLPNIDPCLPIPKTTTVTKKE